MKRRWDLKQQVSKSMPRSYLHTCLHCGEEFISSRKESDYKIGHRPRTAKQYSSANYRFNGKSAQTDIGVGMGFPTVEEARAKRPCACLKCEAVVLEEDSVDALLEAGNGRGVGWRCMLCGWRCVAFPAEAA